MEFLFFDRNDVPLYRRRDALTARHIHEEYKHTAAFPDDPDKPLNAGMRVGWVDDGGALQLFEIRQPVRSQPEGVVSYEAEHIAVAELTDCVVQDKRPRGVSAVTALRSALEGTGWQPGTVDVNPMGSAAFYWISAWEALQSIRDSWGGSAGSAPHLVGHGRHRAVYRHPGTAGRLPRRPPDPEQERGAGGRHL